MVRGIEAIMGRCNKLSIVMLAETLVILLLVQVSWSQIGYYLGTKTASKCFSVAGVPRLDFHLCRPNEMILVQEAFQGIGQEVGQCVYRRGDCVEPTTPETESKLMEECMGRSSCSITVGVAWMPNCKAYSSYNYVIYHCVPREEVLNICSERDRPIFRMGIIASPGYPSKYASNLECQCNVTTDAGQKILLKFLDGNVEWSERCVKDVVQITDGSSKMPRCGKLPRSYNITSRTNKVELYFGTDGWQQNKGFLLQVEALGNLLISCGSLSGERSTPDAASSTSSAATTPTTATTTSVITTTTTTTITPVQDDYEDYYDSSNEEDNYFYTDGFQNTDLPNLQIWPDDDDNDDNELNKGKENARSDSEQENGVGPLVGIIIGSILVLIIIVILIGMCVWIRRHRKKEEISKVPHQSYMSKLQRRNQSNPQQRRQSIDLPPPLMTSGLTPGSPCSTQSRASERTDRTEQDQPSNKSEKTKAGKKEKKMKTKP